MQSARVRAGLCRSVEFARVSPVAAYGRAGSSLLSCASLLVSYLARKSVMCGASTWLYAVSALIGHVVSVPLGRACGIRRGIGILHAHRCREDPAALRLFFAHRDGLHVLERCAPGGCSAHVQERGEVLPVGVREAVQAVEGRHGREDLRR